MKAIPRTKAHNSQPSLPGRGQCTRHLIYAPYMAGECMRVNMPT